MFTGIIQTIGQIRARESRGGDVRLLIAAGGLDMSAVAPGDSIAVNGVCLTAVEPSADAFCADVSMETLSRTTLAELAPGASVNLEPALTLAQRLGGHLVSGHVDGVGVIRQRWHDGRSVRLSIEAPPELSKYIAGKGSIGVDGVSLTVNSVNGSVFELNIVPHTLTATTLGECAAGRRVNLEVDIIARYLERLLNTGAAIASEGVTRELLAAHGFIKPQ